MLHTLVARQILVRRWPTTPKRQREKSWLWIVKRNMERIK